MMFEIGITELVTCEDFLLLRLVAFFFSVYTKILLLFLATFLLGQESNILVYDIDNKVGGFSFLFLFFG